MTKPLRIDFIRGENGKLVSATCTTPKGEMRVSGGYDVTTPKGKARVEASDGVIYRMIIALADDGFIGERFVAHDGRIVCLTGMINKLAVPVRYGGLAKEKDR